MIYSLCILHHSERPNGTVCCFSLNHPEEWAERSLSISLLSICQGLPFNSSPIAKLATRMATCVGVWEGSGVRVI